MREKKPFIIGIAGGSGSGKTTLAHIVSKELPWKTTVIGFDQFYVDLSALSLEERSQYNFDHPDAVDVDLLTETLDAIKKNQSAFMPFYDFTISNRTSAQTPVEPAPIIIVEGIHALYHLPIVAQYDMNIFLDIEDSVRFHRRLERDMRERGRPYEQIVYSWNTFAKPMYKKYVEPSIGRATIVFTESFAPQVVHVLTEQITHHMQMKENVSGVLPH